MSNFEIIKRLYNDYTVRFKYKLLLAIFFTLVVAASTASIAWLLDPAIKKLFIEKNQTLLLLIPGFIILAFTSKGVSLYLARITMIGIANDVEALVKIDLSKALIKADSDYIDDKHSGKFLSNITYDASLLTDLVSVVILNFFKDSLTLIGLLFVMFYQNWKLALIAIIMIPLASFAAKNLGRRMGKITTEAQVEAGNLTSYLLEIFKNHKIIKIFQQENKENIRVKNRIDILKEKNKKIATVLVRATPIMETLTGIMIGSLIFAAGKLILSGELGLNNFFSFLAAMMLAYQPVRSLATLNMTINTGLSAAKRVLPIVDMKNLIDEKKDAINLELKIGNIEFKNVSFKYKNTEKNVLNSINLKIIGGKMNALVGHSGAGKSTILNLIPRFFNCTDGSILIDDQSINKLKIESLRKHISLVSQDTTLFDDTIRNNISYSKPDATDEEIIEASKNSFSHDFIDKLPKKYETQIGENGVKLSGGEKQRLSIARAILKKTSIILLDEATSSLDSETENKIQQGLSFLTKNKTTIVIAHRLSTILNSEKIFVIDKGQLISEGTHSNLLETSSVYKNFYEKQLRRD